MLIKTIQAILKCFIYLKLEFFDFVKFTEKIGLPAI